MSIYYVDLKANSGNLQVSFYSFILYYNLCKFSKMVGWMCYVSYRSNCKEWLTKCHVGLYTSSAALLCKDRYY